MESLGAAYAQERLIPSLRAEVLALWRKHKQRRDRCVIISGGLDVFLKPIAIHLEADDLICSQLEFHNGVCTGRLAGEDNVGVVKAKNLQRRYGTRSYVDSFAYTDNESDLPLLELVGNPCVVVKGSQVPDWATRRGFTLIAVS